MIRGRQGIRSGCINHRVRREFVKIDIITLSYWNMLSAIQYVDKELADRSVQEEKKARKKEKKKEKKVMTFP